MHLFLFLIIASIAHSGQFPHSNSLLTDFTVVRDDNTTSINRQNVTSSISQPEQDSVLNLLSEISKPVQDLTSTISKPVQDLASTISKPVQDLTSTISKPVQDLVSSVSQPIKNLTPKISKPVLNLLPVISQPVQNLTSKIRQPVQNLTSKLRQPVFILRQNSPTNQPIKPANQPIINDPSSNVRLVENVKLPIEQPVENITYTNNRIVHKLNLREIFPLLSLYKDYGVNLMKKKESDKFPGNFYFVLENSNIYFLATVTNPAVVKLNIYLNSKLKADTEDLQKFTKVFEVRENPQSRVHAFKMEIRSTLDQILKSEQMILDEFKNKLWISTNSTGTSDISIVRIKPETQSYELTIASSQPRSELLEEMCFLEKIPRAYFAETGLSIDRREADCESLKVASTTEPIPEEVTVNAFFDVRSKSLTRMSNSAITILRMGYKP